MRFANAAVHTLLVAFAVLGGLGFTAASTALAKKSSAPGRGPSGARSYWVVTDTGKVCAAGEATTYGQGHGRVVAIEGTSDGKGYWLVLKSRKHEAFGDAKHEKYRKAKAVTWTQALGACKAHVVGAAVATVKTSSKSEPKPPAKSTKPEASTTTPATSTAPPATGSTGSSSPADTDPSAASIQPPSAPPPVVTTTTPTDTTTTSTTATTPVDPSIDTASLPHGEVGVAYRGTLEASGGAGGDVWSISSGSLPSGLKLDPSGSINGTPTASGSYSFTVTVTTSDGGTAERSYLLSLLPPISVITTNLGLPEVGIAYDNNAVSDGRHRRVHLGHCLW